MPKKLGDDFKSWCARRGRSEPPKVVVDALNRSLDEGTLEVKAQLQEDRRVWTNFTTFLAGRGTGRV